MINGAKLLNVHVRKYSEENQMRKMPSTEGKLLGINSIS